MDTDTALEIRAITDDLKTDRAALLARGGAAGIQRRAVRALAQIAARLVDSDSGFITGIASADPTFAATVLSLRALMKSCDEAALWALIDSEQVRAPENPPALVAHFIASNTALLAWTSVARALLVGAASLARLPSDAPIVHLWTDEFLAQLERADSDLRRIVAAHTWPTSIEQATRAACNAADTILVYGSDQTVAELKRLEGKSRRFVGYDHRVSFGVVLSDADFTRSAHAQALDIALFDQQGCLSPHCLFVEGDSNTVQRFADALRSALKKHARLFPKRDAAAAARIREIADSARFEKGMALYQAENLAYTIAVSTSPKFQFGGAGGFVYVKPLIWEELIVSLEKTGLLTRLQGVSIAAGNLESYQLFAKKLIPLGVSYICCPGKMQCPPLSWRENGYDVLRSLFSL